MGKNGCIKCGHTEAKTKEIATTGTGLSSLDVQHNHFTVVYFTSCGYSELYNKSSSRGSNIIDLFFGG
ncbi:zinc ribbon domain-containing protein [Priestia megaterium]|uniref:zinc ribbon domain-containing protein n=1 Tax=Priestia megaterium TaxID=1404 RepID=UPI0024529A9A|nr:zinc ribbon domain-containing protein [Priestia megaterium]MDH3187171.1 zinc ribbon domain-containing protein [Priestia megaterium]